MKVTGVSFLYLNATRKIGKFNEGKDTNQLSDKNNPTSVTLRLFRCLAKLIQVMKCRKNRKYIPFVSIALRCNKFIRYFHLKIISSNIKLIDYTETVLSITFFRILVAI